MDKCQISYEEEGKSKWKSKSKGRNVLLLWNVYLKGKKGIECGIIDLLPSSPLPIPSNLAE